MDKGTPQGARFAIRCLYPEPGAARVKDELVRLLLASKVDCGEDLDVEKVGKVLFEEPLAVFHASIGRWITRVVQG